MYQSRSAEDAQQLLNQFARTDPDVLWMFAPDWSELRFGDEAYEEIWGRSLDDLIAEPLDFLNGIHSDDRESVQDAMDTLSDGESAELETRVVVPETNVVRDVWMEGRPVHDDDSSLSAIAVYVRDISERKQYERQLEEITSYLSHDLQNTLRVAMGFLDLAQEDCESEQLVRAEEALARMTQMTSDVLALSQTDKQPIDRESVSLETLAHESWRSTEHDNAELVVEDETTFHVDQGLFQNVLENLFRNAVDHNETAITVRVGPLAESAGFYVADDGSGIEAERRDDVFDVGHSTGGTGLGLPLVHKIVTAHGGSIEVQTSDAGGARFEIAGIRRD